VIPLSSNQAACFLCLKAGGKRAPGTQAEFVREQMGLQFTTLVATCLSRREVCHSCVCVCVCVVVGLWECVSLGKSGGCRSGGPDKGWCFRLREATIPAKLTAECGHRLDGHG
jgi:hypothetical protein